jgi:hypothetical protein
MVQNFGILADIQGQIMALVGLYQCRIEDRTTSVAVLWALACLIKVGVDSREWEVQDSMHSR